MDNNENTVAAEDVMNAQETDEQRTEVSASELMQDGGAQENQAESAQDEKAQSAQDDQVRAYTEGITNLYDMGWTQEEVAALIADPEALRDIVGGKTVGQAAHAFMKRKQSAAQKPAPRRSVPTVKTAAGTPKGGGSRIKEMSKEDFRKLSERAERAMLDGKNVSFD